MSQAFLIDLSTADLSQFTSTTTGSGNTLDAYGSAAKVGSYGMRVIMDDNANATYGYKSYSLSTPNFRLGTWLYLPTYTTQDGVWRPMYWYDSGNARGYVQIQRAGYCLRTRLAISDDTYTTQYSGIPVIDWQTGWHYFEVAVTRASNTSASDGSAYLYLDGWPIARITDLDIYDTIRSPNEWYFGCVSPGGDTDCTIYMDEMELDDDDTTNLYGEKSDPFIALDFEEVDQNEKVSLVDEGTTGTKRYNAADALNSTTIGVSVDASDSSGDLRWSRPGIESPAAGADGWAVRFWIDVSNISQGNNEDFDLFRVVSPDFYRYAIVEIEEYDATYVEIRAAVYQDNNTWATTSQYQITKADEHKITVILTYASDTSSADGTLVFKVDDVTLETVSNIDNFDADCRPADFNWGYRSGSATMTGRIKIDEIIFRHDTTDPDVSVGHAGPLVNSQRLKSKIHGGLVG